MKIKTKLIISFCIIIFVPSILAIATISAYCNFQSHVIEQTYGIKNADAYSIINSVPMLNRYTAPDFEKIKKTIKLSPSKMEDVSYLSEINESLEQKYSYLVVRIGENISFNGGSDNEKILSELPVYGANSSKQGVDKYIDRDDEILVKQADFKLDSGEKCTAYIVTSFDATGQEIRQFILWGIICVVIILLLTAIMMIVWIYRSMITPIQKLRVAAENIKEGNLDFALDTGGDDEIGELCTTFEQMRQRLKDNAEEKLSNEKENRTLISNIAHDLKTPIATIKSYGESIKDGIYPYDTLEKSVDVIIENADRLEQKVHSLLFMNRVEYLISQDCEGIGSNMEEIVETVVQNPRFIRSDIQILTNLEEVYFDGLAEPWRVVVENIIENALRYAKTTIDIHLSEEEGLTISNDGPCMDEDRLKVLFKPYEMGKGGKFGLGLSIVAKVVSANGYEVVGENMAEGVIFRIYKPKNPVKKGR